MNVDPLEAFFKGYGKSEIDHKEHIVEEHKTGETSEGDEWDGGQIYLKTDLKTIDYKLNSKISSVN